MVDVVCRARRYVSYVTALSYLWTVCILEECHEFTIQRKTLFSQYSSHSSALTE
jgi:hypothetical protein